MVGLQENMAKVKESIRDHDHKTLHHEASTRQHERILAEYDTMMRSHERRMHDHRSAIDASRAEREPSLRFRFKASSSSSKKRKHGSQDSSHRSHRHRSRRTTDADDENNDNIEPHTAHPLPRTPDLSTLDPSDTTASPNAARVPSGGTGEGPDDAFRASLFDAIADDEGAAYWEGVYSQPIHVYARPSLQTESGELEQMSDAQYAEYVKAKMWERKNPGLKQERDERARKAKEEELGRGSGGKRRKLDEEHEDYYEWVGDEERGYSRFAGTRRAEKGTGRTTRGGENKDRGFMADVDEALARGARRKEARRWQQAWAAYQQRWTQLKESTTVLQGAELANAVPWPVDTSNTKGVNKENIEKFFLNAVLGEGETRLGLLKAERVRWHPDKIQHRFGGENVDAETLKLVTSVFQTIDEMLVLERRREGKD